jgi:hypothetical protein
MLGYLFGVLPSPEEGGDKSAETSVSVQQTTYTFVLRSLYRCEHLVFNGTGRTSEHKPLFRGIKVPRLTQVSYVMEHSTCRTSTGNVLAIGTEIDYVFISVVHAVAIFLYPGSSQLVSRLVMGF